MNLPVETANEVIEIIITVAQHLQTREGKNSSLHKICYNTTTQHQNATLPWEINFVW